MKAQEISILQGTSEWLDLRKNHIGASEAPIIMEVSKFSTPYSLWCEKLDLIPPKEDNGAMRRGRELEPVAREEAEKKLNVRLMPGVFVKDFQIASLDGICQNNEVMIEIKCPGKIDHEMGMDGVVPQHYYPQLQHQMMVLDIPVMYYMTFNEQSNNLFEVQRDLSYCEKLIEKEKKFWHYLQTLESPPLVDKDYHERNDVEWFEKAQEWHRINKQLKNFEEIEDRLRQELIILAQGKNCKGAGIKISSSVRRGKVNYASIPNLDKVDLEKYRNPKSVVWRLSQE